MKSKKLLLLIAFLAILGFELSAQTTISGKITDESNGGALVGATVAAAGKNVGTTTVADGTFSLSVPDDVTTLRISYVGYRTQDIAIDGRTTINIAMVSSLELNEVVISASRKPEKITESPSSVSVLTAEKLSLLAVPAGDPTNLLKNIQGVSIVQNGINKSNITLRGRSVRNTTRALILKDYRILNDFYTSIYDNERVPVVPIDIDRVEVIRGPSGALWGPGVSAGVIHYISKDPWRHQGLSVELSYGNSFGDEEQGQDANVTKIDLRYAKALSDKFAFKLLGSYKTGRDFIFDLTSTEDFGTGLTIPDYAAGDVSGGGGAATRDGQWTDFAGNTIDMSGEGIGISRADGGGPFNLVPDFYNFNLEGTLEFKPSKNVNLAIVPSLGQSKGNFGNAGIFFHQKSTIFNTQLRANIGKLFASANYRFMPTFDGDTEKSNHWELQYNNTGFRDPGGSNYFDLQAQYPVTFSENTDLVVGGDLRTMVRNHEDTFVDGSTNGLRQLGIFADERYTVAGGYAQLTHKFTDKFKAVVAARVDNFNIYGSAFSPKVGLVYNPKPNSAFRLSYNQANTAPVMVRSYFQSTVGRRGNNIKGNLLRHFYGAGQDITFNNPLTGLSIAGNTLGFHFSGTDVPLQNVLDALGVEGITVSGTSAGSLFTIENTGSNSQINNVNQLDNPRADLETSETYELGYKGLITDKLSVGIDLYYNIEKNVPTAAVAISPGVSFPNLGSDLSAALSSAGVDPTEAAALVERAVADFGTGVTGIVVADQHQDLGIINGMTYGFRGYGEIEYFGIDFSADYYFDERNSAFLTWSWVNQNDFTSEDIGEDPALNRVFQLNTPTTRIRAGYNYGTEGGLFGNVSVQYNNEYFANFGDFRGTMPSMTSVDLAVGYKIMDNVSLSLSATNLFDEDIYGLPYLPRQGRIVLATLRFTPGN